MQKGLNLATRHSSCRKNAQLAVAATESEASIDVALQLLYELVATNQELDQQQQPTLDILTKYLHRATSTLLQIYPTASLALHTC